MTVELSTERYLIAYSEGFWYAVRPGVPCKVFTLKSEFKERFVKLYSFSEIQQDFMYLRDLNSAPSGEALSLFRTISFISDYKVQPRMQ